MKKLFLTSAITLCTICPAMAETFPVDGNMLENKTYDEAATYTNMGVYEGTVSANAYYDDIVYNIAAGNYLAAGSEATNGTQCPAGSWCPGISNINYSANTNQGLNACPNDYSNSVAGASANTQCYRTCSTDDVAHSASVTGQMYYDGTSGDGVNACEPATCVSGWHKKNGLNLATAIGTSEECDGYVATDSAGEMSDSDNDMTPSGAGISGDQMAFAIDSGANGMIHGHGRCSTRSVADSWVGNNDDYVLQNDGIVSSLTDETGQNGALYCYCHLDSYTPVNGSAIALSNPWVFLSERRDAGDCAYACSYDCAYNLGHREGVSFRSAVFGTITSTLASCEANTITINWNGATQAAIDANNAGTTVYEGDIRTPQSAISVPGKTFRGWKFVKSNN